MIELVFIGAFILGAFLSVLGVGGVISDYIFPHIKALTRWMNTLPLMNGLEELEEDDRV